jgi:fluoroquinolone transport system permease protein
MERIRRYIVTDFKNILRDDMLVYFIMIPITMSIAARWVIPYLTDFLVKKNINLIQMLPAVSSFFFLIMPPAIIGFVYGFMWIDERDEKILSVLQITPVPFIKTVIIKMSIGAVISFLLVLVVIPMSGIGNIKIPYLILAGSLTAFNVPLFALFLFDFAKNKIEGFAISKYLYILYMLPFICYFVKVKYEFLFGIIPSYWVLKLYWLISEGNMNIGFYYITGILFNFAVVIFLLKRYVKVAYKIV